MQTFPHATQAAKEIKQMAARAVAVLPAGSAAHSAARAAHLRPMNYMRHAEFEVMLAHIDVKPGAKVLDASSPQWLALYLAHRNPGTQFTYMNIIDRELDPFRQIAEALQLRNLDYTRGDLRSLSFSDDTFDLAISVSVIEHVYPEAGGDVAALKELRRVIKPSGVVMLTVPFKADHNLVYTEGAVYERSATGMNFYAREYDADTFSQLIAESHMAVTHSLTIRERSGLLALDALEWGWGRSRSDIKFLLRVLRRMEVAIGKTIDGALSRRYLNIDNEGAGRLVNIYAMLSGGKG